MSADQNSPERKRHLPSTFYNAITLAGATIAAIALGLIAFLVVLEMTATEHNPYMGIVAFILLPAFLVIGLIIRACIVQQVVGD